MRLINWSHTNTNISEEKRITFLLQFHFGKDGITCKCVGEHGEIIRARNYPRMTLSLFMTGLVSLVLHNLMRAYLQTMLGKAAN